MSSDIVMVVGQARRLAEARVLMLMVAGFEEWMQREYPALALERGTNVSVQVPGPHYMNATVQGLWHAWWSAIQQPRVTVSI